MNQFRPSDIRNLVRHLPCYIAIAAALSLLVMLPAGAAEPFTLKTASGYRGIWYSNQKTGDEYVYKYSGGMATYPQQHVPIAIYAPAVNKTFFVYGGNAVEGDNPDKQRLVHMVSYFDHATGRVPRPRILLDKKTDDAHDNPTLAIDAQGHVWIFSNSHGTSRPSYIHRSARPYDIDAFERVVTTNFSYSQPWHLADAGFLVLHTHYKSGRGLFWMNSRDGRDWSEPAPLASVALGHYQVSWSDGKRVATAFDYHPKPDGLNARTNLYFLQSSDAGQTWCTAAGEVVKTPLTGVKNAALVHNYEADGLLVYLKEVRFDAAGRPLVLYLTSHGWRPGPDNGPHQWRITRWTGREWQTNDAVKSDHNYDFGTLSFDADDTWRLIAPTDPGAQPYGTGGQMELWTSTDQGHTWNKDKVLTHDARRNHSFARMPVGARDDFFALWADGDTRKPSGSSLYFTDRRGTHVWRLPTTIDGESVQPEIAW